MQYPDLAAYAAPARARPQVWRLIAGLVLVLAVHALVLVVIVLAALVISGVDVVGAFTGTDGPAAEQIGAEIARVIDGDSSPTAVLLILFTFVGMVLGVFLAAELLHGRWPGTLFGPRPRLLRHFILAVLSAGAVFALSFLLPGDVDPQPGLERGIWLSFLPLALAAVLLQTGAEELVLRGYVQQQLAARFASPLIWMVLPSALFAIGHYDPAGMGANAWLVVAAAGLFGLCAADLTAKTGSLGAAWGFHFANNVLAILIVSLDGPLSGLALYVSGFGPEDVEVLRPLILRDMGVTVAAWAAIRVTVSR